MTGQDPAYRKTRSFFLRVTLFFFGKWVGEAVMSQIQGPAWDNSQEYAGFDSQEFALDFELVKQGIAEIRETLSRSQSAMAGEIKNPSSTLSPEAQSLAAELQKVARLRHKIVILAYNLGAYANLESSVDAQFERARQEAVRMQDQFSELTTALMPLNLFLKRCSIEFLQAYLATPETATEAFYIQEGRRAEIYSLTESEEVTLNQFRNHGPTAWGRLYNQMAGTIQVETQLGKMGLAQASGYLRSSIEAERRDAWLGIQKSWKPYEEPVSAILNSLAGWRLEEYRKRSARAPMDFLTQPLLDSRIERPTLDAMMAAIQMRQDLTRKSLKLMGRAMGKDKVDPWDLLAPAPVLSGASPSYSFDEAISLIRKTFQQLHPDMVRFLDAMVENKWIEGRVLPNKRTGAFCSGFQKSRTPRVFQTYMGSLQDVSTLAHELGHAFHSWIMRDIPFFETRYPMTLAETASIFCETALADEMARSGNSSLMGEVAWADVQAESQFWMTKLHFSIPGVSFYNFPYSFGYLFSLAVYSYREEWGASFYPKYCELLRDTGRMSAEALAQKHLGQDLRSPEFWMKSLTIVEKKISRFEDILNSSQSADTAQAALGGAEL